MSQETNTQEFIVTARKWRPLKFKDVVGQEHITTTLKNSISSNRVHHAYLFSGPRGVGKTTTARILARALNCTNPQDFEPCNQCSSCISIIEGRSLDVIEIDGASNNSVDDIRKLRENAKYAPVSGNYKMYIIDEVHMLSTSAFNALLKTLEEPPPHLMFVFATTEPHKLPATILSRCQRYGFRRMEIPSIVAQLKHIAKQESIEIDEESLITIAKKADGSMRDSQSIFDQVIAFCGVKITYAEMADALHLIDQDLFFRITRSIKDKDLTDIFNITKEVVSKGFDLMETLGGLLEHFRNILTARVTGSSQLIESSGEYLEKYEKLAKEFSKADILRMMQLISQTEQSLRYSPQPRIRFETALVQMALMDSALDISALLAELKNMKNMNHSVETKEKPTDVVRDFSKEYKPQITIKPEEKKESFKMPSISKPEENQVIPTVRDLSAAKISERWDEFVNTKANQTTGLHFLAQSDIIDANFFNNEILLKISNKFAFENLSLKKSMLAQSLADFYGSHISVKIISVEQKKTETVDKQNEGLRKNEWLTQSDNEKDDIPLKTNFSNKELSDDSSKHPVELKIIELFDVKKFEG